MFFIVKCILCLAVVFWLLPWRPSEPDRPVAAAPAQTRPVAAKAKDGAAREPRPPAREESLLSGLSGALTDKLVDAARERCLAHPRECLSVLDAATRADSRPH